MTLLPKLSLLVTACIIGFIYTHSHTKWIHGFIVSVLHSSLETTWYNNLHLSTGTYMGLNYLLCTSRRLSWSPWLQNSTQLSVLKLWADTVQDSKTEQRLSYFLGGWVEEGWRYGWVDGCGCWYVRVVGVGLWVKGWVGESVVEEKTIRCSLGGTYRVIWIYYGR